MAKRADAATREGGSRNVSRQTEREPNAASNRDAGRGRQEDPHRDNGHRAAPPAQGGRSRLSGSRAAMMARQQIEELLGVPVETITGLARHQDGFTVMLEVIEIERIPRTTDILATYRVELTPDGELDGYERVNRYYRNQTNGGGEE